MGIPEINTNRDGEIQCYEAEAYTGAINCAAAGIENLTGIEAFTSLTALRCGYNALTTLDLSNNPMLTILYCFSNQLTSVNIADNLLLTDFRCDDNRLTSLDVSGNPALSILYCSGNQLTSVDVSNNPALTDLRCSRNMLTILDISDVTSLTVLVAFQNQLDTLILADNNILSVVNIGDNRFRFFDATGLPALTQLSVERNLLRSLNVANGNNTAFTYFHSQENPDLGCIQVDNAAYSNNTWQGASFQKNTGIPFGEDCYALTCIVDIPDATFKTFLLRDPAINTNGDQHIQCSEAEAFTGTIDCSNRVITDLTGIEAFVNATQLICTNARLTTLDLSRSNALTVLYCDGNQLASLDISGSSRLTSLRCHNNQLASLDISNNTSLHTVWAYLNQLTDFVSVGNAAPEELNIRNNNLTDFDATRMTALKRFSIENNQLVSLNVANGENQAFTHFTSDNNPALECIQVDDELYSVATWVGAAFQKSVNAHYSEDCSVRPCEVNIPDANFKAYLLGNNDINRNGDNRIQCEEAEAFTGSISCAGRSIADLTGIEAFVNISGLYCQENQLSSLDLRHNTALQFLVCHSNRLTLLNIGANPALKGLNCGYNQLSTLDLRSSTGLMELLAENNRLTTLDLSAHSALNRLVVRGNQLGGLNVRNGNNNQLGDFDARNNPGLVCIQVDDVMQSVARWSVCCADDKQSFSENCYVASCVVQIPDAGFRTCLLANELVNTNGDSEIQCEEAEAFTGAVDCANMNIADLTGIEYFVNATELIVSGNALTTLDVSELPALKKIAVENNQLTSLNVANGNNSDFVHFSAYNNPGLVSIEVDDAGYSAASWTGSGFQFDAAATFRDPGEVTSIGDRVLTAQVNLYPNPAERVVTIEHIPVGTRLTVSDVAGREVYYIKATEEYQTIYTGDWPRGVYFIQLENNHGSVNKKLIISR